MSAIASKNVTEKVELESSPCPLGCLPEDEFVLTGRDRLHDLPGEFDIVRCITCGLMRTNPHPTQETMGFYYPESYGPWLNPPKGNFSIPVKPLALWKRIIKKIFVGKEIQMTPPIGPGKLLEIGCGNGTFLHTMASEGWQVQGIESSATAGQAVKELGYPIYIGPLESAPNLKDPLDLIVGWHVFEHLHDPILSLKKLAQWLKPEGYLVLSFPNAASLEFKFFTDRWYALHLPNHLYHFTPKTAHEVLKASGWKIEKIIHERSLKNLKGSIGYLIQDFIGPSEALDNWFKKFPMIHNGVNIFLAPLARFLAYMGQTGRMIIWAKKIND